jgi:tetratricopeptide (TPR) repeat protein
MKSPAKSPPTPGLPTWAAAGLITAAVLLVYANSFSVPFLLDDQGSIEANPTLGSLASALRPPAGGDTVSGRPVLNVSFALSHALSGLEVWGYHLLNLLIHAANSLLVYGLVARTLRRAGRSEAGWFALVAAFLWGLHPLQTESVTYISQRAESLVALFYLLTLYAFVRAVEAPAPRWWQVAAVAACALGMAAKEVMVTAPLLVFLYDRTFVGGTFRAAWAERRRFHAALAVTWGVLGALLLNGTGRGGTAVAGDASSWHYLLTQADALVRYLRLSLLPTGQVFDYGTRLVTNVGAVWWQGLVVLALLGATAWALVRRPALGFLGALFFAVLAPSSSFLPVLSQVMAEHRMYLPLVSVVVVVLAALQHWLGRNGLIAAALAVPVLAVATLQRNLVYRDAIGLWRDTIRNHPGSDRAHNNLGALLREQGDLAGAAAEFQEALRLRPDYLRALSNLGLVLLQQGDTAGGLARIAELLRLRPDDFDAWVNYARLLEKLGRSAEAVPAWERAVQLHPAAADLRNSLGSLLLRLDRGPEAVRQFAEAVRLQPADPAYLGNLGSSLAVAGRLEDAVVAYNRSLALRPDSASVRAGLALALRGLGRNEEAAVQARQALQIDPGFAAARALLNTLTGGR